MGARGMLHFDAGYWLATTPLPGHVPQWIVLPPTRGAMTSDGVPELLEDFSPALRRRR